MRRFEVVLSSANVTRAAAYIRTDASGTLPSAEEQSEALQRFSDERGFDLLHVYEDLDAPGKLLYGKPSLREAIDNIKEREEWEVLVAYSPACFSETISAVHELTHKFALYGNRLECPQKAWEEFESEMKQYRREMSGR